MKNKSISTIVSIFLICIGIIGAILFIYQGKAKEADFNGEIIVNDGVIESITQKHTKSGRRSGSNTYYTGIVDIDGSNYEMFLNYGKEADYEIGDIINCYGYDDEYYISETSLIRNNVKTEIYFAGAVFFSFMTTAGLIIFVRKWIIKRKSKKI